MLGSKLSGSMSSAWGSGSTSSLGSTGMKEGVLRSILLLGVVVTPEPLGMASSGEVLLAPVEVVIACAGVLVVGVAAVVLGVDGVKVGSLAFRMYGAKSLLRFLSYPFCVISPGKKVVVVKLREKNS